MGQGNQTSLSVAPDGPSEESEKPRQHDSEGAARAPSDRRLSAPARWLVGSIALLLIAVTMIAGALVYLRVELDRPGPLAGDRAVFVPHGTPIGRIGALLEENGVVSDGDLFAVGARIFGRSRALQAGEYAFPAAVSPREVIAILQSGETIVRRLTVPEGLTRTRVLELVDAAEGLQGRVGRIPEEGRLLPETYYYSYGDNRADMVARMEEAMEIALARLWLERTEDLPLATPQDALTLASIVERETAIERERRRVAAVFINRLRRGMPLQSDPTVAYALTEGDGTLERQLVRDDLRIDHPYNTYLNAGLPPGPIANPGRASIEAVLNPAETDELYFVADGSGGHAFAATLEEHNRNVARWRRLRRQADEGASD